MNINLKNAVLLTHKDCLDGSACAIVWKEATLQLLGKERPVYFTNPEQMEVDRAIYNIWDGPDGAVQVVCADISPSVPICAANTDSLFVIDHHKTALPLVDFPNSYIDMSMCGSKLLYRELNAHADWLDPFLESVNDYDLWINENKYGDFYALLHNFWGQQRFTTPPLPMLGNIDGLWDLFEVLNEKRNAYVKKALERTAYFTIDGHNAAFVICERGYANDTLNNILKNTNAVIAIGVDFVAGSASVRGLKDGPIDCSSFCKARGGGGHFAAGGFPLYVEEENLRLLEVLL